MAERMVATWRGVALLALLVAGLGVAAPAGASPILVRDGDGDRPFGAAGSKVITIGVDSGAGIERIRVEAGAFYLQYSTTGAKGVWTNFVTYCMEPDELLNVSGIVKGDYQADAGRTPEYASRARELAGLYGTWFEDSLTSATKTAAFQVALWEVLFDTDRDLGSGLFHLVGSGGDTDRVRAQANAYLVNWTTMEMPGAIIRAGSQDLLMPPAAVPEPAALMLFGAGVMVLIGLRFRPCRA